MSFYQRAGQTSCRDLENRKRVLLAELLEAFCSVPVEADAVLVDSLWDRWSHADLLGLTPAELSAEERCVELRSLLDPAPPGWLSDRLAAVRQELRRRGR